MTAQEVHRLLAVIRVAYPNWQKGQEIAASNLWEEALADIDYDAANAALKRHISTNKFAPTIAEIREPCTKTRSENTLMVRSRRDLVRALSAARRKELNEHREKIPQPESDLQRNNV